MKVKHCHISNTPHPHVLHVSLAESHMAVCNATTFSFWNPALRATGQADTYEIFPLLTLATASAGEINPLSADTGSSTHTHKLLLMTIKHSSSNSSSNNSVLVVIITASVDLFQPYFLTCSLQGGWHAMEVMNCNHMGLVRKHRN